MKSMILSLTSIGGALAMIATAASAETTAPSYLTPELPIVKNLHPILTVGDTVGGYRMVGIPDGMGAYNTGKDQFTLFMNHELTQSAGIPRAHGAKGAFVSDWLLTPTIDPNGVNITVDVLSGQDTILNVQDWDDINGGYVAIAGGPTTGRFSRLCSAYLAGPHDGFDTYMFFTGEETGGTDTCDGVQGGQSFAVIDDTAWALPCLGRYPHENQVVVPGTGNKTLVVGLDDGPACCSQVYFTIGEKIAGSKDVLERNGLSNGQLYVMKVQGLTFEDQFATVGQSIPFTMELVDWTLNGSALEAASDVAGGTKFARVEDGDYDPTNYSDFYFVTTGNGISGNVLQNGRMYRLTFSDLNNPVAGGTITMLLDGTEGVISPDNIGVNSHGQLLINEDATYTIPNRDAGIWLYNIFNGNLNFVLEFDTALAMSKDATYSNGKWETSGVIDATNVIGDGWWIFNVQAHYNLPDPELVQGGQLLVTKIDTLAAPGDATGNGIVDVDDLLRVINQWGDGCALFPACTGDLNGDDSIDVDDLLLVINNWSL